MGVQTSTQQEVQPNVAGPTSPAQVELASTGRTKAWMLQFMPVSWMGLQHVMYPEKCTNQALQRTSCLKPSVRALTANLVAAKKVPPAAASGIRWPDRPTAHTMTHKGHPGLLGAQREADARALQFTHVTAACMQAGHSNNAAKCATTEAPNPCFQSYGLAVQLARMLQPVQAPAMGGGHAVLRRSTWPI